MPKNHLNFLTNEEWKSCVKNLPIIAIDLIIQNKNSEILMGKRLNNPAKNFFFVPGGRVLKNEKINDAFERISLDEIGRINKIEDATFLNYYEHFYPNSIWEIEKISTHYIVLAFKLNSNKNDKFDLNNQHKDFKWISKKNQNNYKIHKYSLNYLNN